MAGPARAPEPERVPEPCDRLSSLDAAFLYLEGPKEPLHVGAVAVLDGSVHFEALQGTLGVRLGALRRYRQRPAPPPFGLGSPTWEDDPDFDPRRHLRRVTVRAPGREDELHRVVDSLFAIPMDPRHPLWEAYLIEGLAGGRSALFVKAHHCMIDGVSGAQVLELVTDAAEQSAACGAPNGLPGHASQGERVALDRPGRGRLKSLGSALAAVASPGFVLACVRGAVEAAGVVAWLAREPPRPLPFNGPLGEARRIVWSSFALDDFLAMRGAFGCKVNDVVLAVIAGALRRYLLAHGVAGEQLRVRALVPVNVRRDHERLALGNRVSAMFSALPVDVADPVERLRRVTLEMRALKERRQPQAVELALAVADALPAAAVPLVTRLVAHWPVVNTVCTNVPGPRETRYVLGCRVLEIHPIVPIAIGLGLGFAILSYDGKLSISATADARLVPDAERVAEALVVSAGELRAALGVAADEPAARAGRPLVRDLMTGDVATVMEHDSLATAWERMHQRRIRHLPVVNRGGRLIGLVTHRDLLAAAQSSLSFRAEAERIRLLGWAEAGDVMETHVSTAAREESAEEAGRRMVRHKIGCLPVIEKDGHLIGIVTEEDFLRWATERMASSA